MVNADAALGGQRTVYALVLRILDPPSRRRSEARRVRRRARRRVLAAIGRSRNRRAVSSARRHARVHAARVRLALPFAPTEFTQVNARSTACWCAERWRCSTPRPGERVADFFCGLGNFTLPIARRGAARRRRRGQRGARARARRRTPTATASPDRTTFDVRESLRGDAGTLAAARPARPRADRPAARRRDRARQGAAAQRRRARAAADRLRVVQPRHTRARCGRAGPRARLPTWPPRASSTCSRTRRTWSRWRVFDVTQRGDRCPKKNGARSTRPVLTLQIACVSRADP